MKGNFAPVIIYLVIILRYYICIDTECIRKEKMIAQFVMILIAVLVWGTIIVIDAYAKSRLPKRNEPLKAAKLSKRSTKKVRKATLDELYFRCKDLSEQGEVTYFSIEDIWNIKEELIHSK